MIRVWTLFALGAALGAPLAGAEGAALGAVLGCLLGLAWHASRNRAVAGVSLEGKPRVHERLMCVPRGEVAECDVVRDERTGQWLDVERCSLQPSGAPDCPKQCLEMLNDARVAGP